MSLSTDEARIRRCYELALRAVQHGSEPFGALLVKDDTIIMEAENATRKGEDPTRHAETELLDRALRELGIDGVRGATIYTSTEPCLMCCGKMYWAGLARLVFGVRISELRRLMDFDYRLTADGLFESMSPRIPVSGPVLEADGLAQHRTFWTARD